MLVAMGGRRQQWSRPVNLAIGTFSKSHKRTTAPMIPRDVYRLKDYRICQLANDRLWWQAHSEFGSQISGPCYIWGEILLMGARCNEEIGFLKSEFLDSLRKLPHWRKTRYYCFASALLDVHTGRVVNEHLLVQKIPRQGYSNTFAETIPSRESGSFRLGRYHLMVNSDGQITWKCSGGADSIIVGQAVIESGILFLGPGQIGGEKTTKKEYLRTLRKLPEWRQTILWCRSLALKALSNAEKPTHSLSFGGNKTYSQREITSSGRRHWDYSKWLWSRSVHFHRRCLDHVRARWPHKDLAELVRKVRKKIVHD